MVRGGVCGALLLAAVVLGAAGPAPACVGDCNGDGGISVAELVTGVRIGLGDEPLSTCPAYDATPDGMLHIEELIAAVADALAGCPATPSPSSSPTDTPNATATPSATPTPPIMSGQWREDAPVVTASTCLELLTQEFAADLAARPPCEQSVDAVSGGGVALLDCTGTFVAGALDPDGTLHFTYPTAGDTTEGCIVALSTSLVVPAAVSPTTATYTFAIQFSGTCPLGDCTIDAQATWTRH
jgi:hypothetical protein